MCFLYFLIYTVFFTTNNTPPCQSQYATAQVELFKNQKEHFVWRKHFEAYFLFLLLNESDLWSPLHPPIEQWSDFCSFAIRTLYGPGYFWLSQTRNVCNSSLRVSLQCQLNSCLIVEFRPQISKKTFKWTSVFLVDLGVLPVQWYWFTKILQKVLFRQPETRRWYAAISIPIILKQALSKGYSLNARVFSGLLFKLDWKCHLTVKAVELQFFLWFHWDGLCLLHLYSFPPEYSQPAAVPVWSTVTLLCCSLTRTQMTNMSWPS